MKYSTTGKGVYELIYHLVFTTKNRNKVLTQGISRDIQELICHILEKNQSALLEFSSDQDFIKIKMNLRPTANLIKLINTFKTISSRMAHKKYGIQALWNSSYLVATIGSLENETITRYIENQGNLIKPPFASISNQ